MPLLEPVILLGGASVIFALGLCAGLLGSTRRVRAAINRERRLSATVHHHMSTPDVRRI